VYNEERYLPEMLDSILAQTSKVDQIIIIDDHSTDGTPNVIAKYQETNAHISYSLSKKKGKAYALETGLELVKTELFFICAGDDKLLPNYVEYLYFEMLVKYNIRYCYAKYSFCNEKLEYIGELKRKLFYSDEEVLYTNFLSGYLFGYSAIIQDILPLPSNLDFEDWYIVITLTSKYKRSYISPDPIFLYRRHGKSTTTLLGSRDKYLGLINRDIRFLSRLDEFPITLTEEKNRIVKRRLEYYKTLVDFKYTKSLPLLFSTSLTLMEKIKLLVFPIFVRLKYKT
jgi:glycosyltransferase involved in cell wall biosynthesis